ncbi:PREDICTED: angiotensin-converting enzyme-like [Dinoponera quadriceps]|uniref:Angiotensin-converting enzyme-like n=1 Tax=Dinoponera quadriceps TaxID=609295 RepID=A0A6P3XAI9_DINQU|nr:PREDICTED: angiotensin-converting enzyme-like [Dinoponera quadriceps]XP_014475427.1 PREDICTED: angiotensin-converting enzyme-like [Dinoponera quadriceps]
MLSKWSWILLNLIIYVNTAPVESETEAFLELTELDYEDACYHITNAQWSFIVAPSNESLLAWEAQQYEYGTFKKTQKTEILKKVSNNEKLQLESLLQYKYDVIKKPGDALLKEEDWEKLVHFVGAVELQRSTNSYVNKSQKYSREDVEYLLSHSGKASDKQVVWNGWYRELKSLVTNYSNNLPLINEAAKENGAKNVEEYWEMLAGYPDAYEKIRSEWSRIDIFHKKILKFIGTNLSKKYGITINDTIPAHLLGSLQGYDWTDLPSDTLPHSNLIYGVKKNLWKKKYAGKPLYKIASNLGSLLFKRVPQAKFWDYSEFNGQCPSSLLNLCRDGIMRVSTCSKATVSNFMAAHKDVGRILFNQMTVESTPILNTVNRFSGLEESISILFGILSTSPAWINHTGLMNASNDNEQRMIVSLMIAALDIFPRLAYYYSVDMWRLNAIEKNINEPADLVSSWWKYRQEYEGVSSIDATSPTFLDDSYIISNKPYLPKILGTLLAFQLYEFIVDSTEVRYNNIDGKLMDSKIIKMIQIGGARNWPDILNENLEIDDIYADALISYFTPLEELIELNEEDFKYKSGSNEDEELEKLEKLMLQEINAPTTTLPPSTTITTDKRITAKATSSVKPRDKANQSKVENPPEFTTSVHILENKPNSPDSSGSIQVPVNESLIPGIVNNTQDNTPKINTSKTVWVVSAVLIAIIVICIIAIFGRRRCRKTPKNRRYV